jgi:hypothetical protein
VILDQKWSMGALQADAHILGRVGVALGLQEVVDQQHKSIAQHAQQAKRRTPLAPAADASAMLQVRTPLTLAAGHHFIHMLVYAPCRLDNDTNCSGVLSMLSRCRGRDFCRPKPAPEKA